MTTTNGAIPQDEKDMREFKAPTPETTEELAAFVNALVDREHDYGTCVYAMSLAAVAAFNFVAHKLGVTGFQASCADLDILTRTRNMQGPFMIVDGANVLYPQYDLVQRVREFVDETEREWAPAEAQKLLDGGHEHAVSTVVEHWRRLAALASADSNSPGGES